MRRLSIVSIVMIALLGLTIRMCEAESETFTGAAARSGTYKRPLLDVDGKRYELKAYDKADASVGEMLAKFSQGDTGRYAVVGTRGIVNGNDGIVIDSISPADKPLPNAGAATPAAGAVQGIEPAGAAQVTSAVTSSVVTVGSERYLRWGTKTHGDHAGADPVHRDKRGAGLSRLLRARDRRRRERTHRGPEDGRGAEAARCIPAG